MGAAAASPRRALPALSAFAAPPGPGTFARLPPLPQWVLRRLSLAAMPPRPSSPGGGPEQAVAAALRKRGAPPLATAALVGGLSASELALARSAPDPLRALLPKRFEATRWTAAEQRLATFFERRARQREALLRLTMALRRRLPAVLASHVVAFLRTRGPPPAVELRQLCPRCSAGPLELGELLRHAAAHPPP
jgi:hypothetical protein